MRYPRTPAGGESPVEGQDKQTDRQRCEKNTPPNSQLALEAVKRIDALFEIERGIGGETAERHLAALRFWRISRTGCA